MITEEYSMPFRDGVRDHYRAAVAELVDESGEATHKQEAKELASGRIATAVADGELAEPDLMSQIMSELESADLKDKRNSDVMIEALCYGQEHLSIPELLDIVVTLGAGKRKPWGQVTWEDMEVMDELRYSNMEKQQVAYQEWRSKFRMIRDALRNQAVSIESLLLDGPLMPMGDE